ncbi:hypothetical protein GCM10014715_35440 [Streptomyces spiralis]|uniref:Uncharacterized protein n=1 Tax=Streptomyces spiralis TaxID=66376 RepID=A0A919DU01_9ACTN|nr:hypothetical protein GCM10014715_35440 [Streptomyces spiralis]
MPFVAVFLMPGAVAGATLLARDLLDEETVDRTDGETGDRDTGDHGSNRDTGDDGSNRDGDTVTRAPQAPRTPW